MSAVTTTRPINVEQLTDELGAGLVVNFEDGTYLITCHDDTVTQAQLQAAVDAHVPADPPPSEDARLQAQIDELTDLILGGI